jgi:hypothetical protein
MRLHDGVRALAIAGTIGAIAAPAAQATQAMQPSGGGPAAAPVVSQQPGGSTDWLLIGAGTGVVVLGAGIAGSRRIRWRAAHTHTSS